MTSNQEIFDEGLHWDTAERAEVRKKYVQWYVDALCMKPFPAEALVIAISDCLTALRSADKGISARDAQIASLERILKHTEMERDQARAELAKLAEGA